MPIEAIGTNTPLIKRKGNLIRVAKSIMFDGLSAGGADINVPKAEKQKAAIILPATKEKLTIPPPKSMIITSKIKALIKRPNIAEAIMSPRIIAQRGIGEDTNLSKVFILVSQGAITGVMAETVKKSAIPKRPGIRKSKDKSLLKKKAINKNKRSVPKALYFFFFKTASESNALKEPKSKKNIVFNVFWPVSYTHLTLPTN